MWNKILFKHYAEHVKRASERLKKESLRPFEQQQLRVVFVRSPQVDKDGLARQVAAWEEQFLRFMHEQRPDVRNALVKERKLSKDLEQQLTAAVQAFQPQFKG